METRSLYLAAYDVADPRRLRAALGIVKGFSTGGQKSVHECFFTAGERTRLLIIANAQVFSASCFHVCPDEEGITTSGYRDSFVPRRFSRVP
jgi:hypothetical protein